jgi:hypothetical protein
MNFLWLMKGNVKAAFPGDQKVFGRQGHGEPSSRLNCRNRSTETSETAQ